MSASTDKILNLTPLEGQALRFMSQQIDLEKGEDPVQFATDMANVAIEEGRHNEAEACRGLAMKLSMLRKSLSN